jgi:hypothetical protein
MQPSLLIYSTKDEQRTYIKKSKACPTDSIRGRQGTWRQPLPPEHGSVLTILSSLEGGWLSSRCSDDLKV